MTPGPTAERSVLLKRALYSGSDGSFVQAMDLALTPAVFGLLGYVLDRYLGTVPVFTIVFVLWAMAVVTWRAWRRYDDSMRREEEQMTGGPQR
ncbi:MAG: AtpZ/AtpI family protein [Actinomycetota bacterium]